MTTKRAAVLVGVAAVALAMVRLVLCTERSGERRPGDSTLSFDVEFRPFFFWISADGVRQVTDVRRPYA